MNQFEFDQLTILAGSFDLEALKAIEPIAKVCRRHAKELRDQLRFMDTAPGTPPDGEPDRLPPMGAPRVPTFTNSEFPTGVAKDEA